MTVWVKKYVMFRGGGRMGATKKVMTMKLTNTFCFKGGGFTPDGQHFEGGFVPKVAHVSKKAQNIKTLTKGDRA